LATNETRGQVTSNPRRNDERTADSAGDLAQTPVGVAVRVGAAQLDISTVDAFKQASLRAKGVNFPISTTGIYMTDKLFPRLGIARELSGKIKDSGVDALVSGESEIAVQPVSEQLHVPGVDSARRIIAFLTSERTNTAIRKHGMEPVRSR
jgi:molybdate transport system substrate-binding protein